MPTSVTTPVVSSHALKSYASPFTRMRPPPALSPAPTATVNVASPMAAGTASCVVTATSGSAGSKRSESVAPTTGRTSTAMSPPHTPRAAAANASVVAAVLMGPLTTAKSPREARSGAVVAASVTSPVRASYPVTAVGPKSAVASSPRWKVRVAAVSMPTRCSSVTAVAPAAASRVTRLTRPWPRFAAAKVACALTTRLTKSRCPPLSKNPFTASGNVHQRPPSVGSVANALNSAGVGGGRKSPKVRANSRKLVTRLGRPSLGPRTVTPTAPVVLVLTPSMGWGPVSTSSM